jgi:hypothetical protein
MGKNVECGTEGWICSYDAETKKFSVRRGTCFESPTRSAYVERGPAEDELARAECQQEVGRTCVDCGREHAEQIGVCGECRNRIMAGQ